MFIIVSHPLLFTLRYFGIKAHSTTSPRKFNTLQGSYRKQYFETIGNKERKRKDKVYLK